MNKDGYLDILVLLRNPSGKDIKGERWTGDWCKDCDLWTKHTKKQIGAAKSKESKATFWMSLGDVIEIFNSFTINYPNPNIVKWTIAADFGVENIVQELVIDKNASEFVRDQ